MSCDKQSDLLIKKLIYNNKVVIFGLQSDDYTNKAIEFFKSKYNYENKIGNVYLDNTSVGDLNGINIENLNECLKKRTGTNKIPMVYLNGMFIGGWRSVENMNYRKEFDIFF